MRTHGDDVCRAVLGRAADLIEEFGWVQGMARDLNGAYCVIGAVSMAIAEHRRDRGFDRSLSPPAMTAMRAGIRERYDLPPRLATCWDPAEVVVGWHDMPGRTKSEVVGLLRELADTWPDVDDGLGAYAEIADTLYEQGGLTSAYEPDTIPETGAGKEAT